MGNKITISTWELAYIIEPRSLSERHIRLEKVLANGIIHYSQEEEE